MIEEFYKKFIKEQPPEVIIAKLIQNDERAKEIIELKAKNKELEKNLKKWESKVKEILEQYKYTEIGDTDKIIEFYKKIQELLEES